MASEALKEFAGKPGKIVERDHDQRHHRAGCRAAEKAGPLDKQRARSAARRHRGGDAGDTATADKHVDVIGDRQGG